MQTYTLSEARNHHGEIFDRASVEPVLFTKQSRPSHVLLSATAYQNLLDKLAELEDAISGQSAVQALSTGKMVGSETFTTALMELANGET
jgi:prevent-host-death family protein